MLNPFITVATKFRKQFVEVRRVIHRSNATNSAWNFAKAGAYATTALMAAVITYKMLVQKSPGVGEVLAFHQLSLREKFNFIGHVVKKCAPGVVYIEIQDPKRIDPETNQPLIVSNGSGFVIREDGWILTNAHVVINKPRAIISVKMYDGSMYNATVEDADMNIDLALIKVSSERSLPFLKFAQPDDLTVGEWVVALGSPLSLSHSVTAGIISSVNRAASELGLRNHEMQYIQTDASITFGNSGGPLVNLDGNVIGINNLRITAGISFAIPISYAQRFLDNGRHPLSRNGGMKEIELRKQLGMTTLPITDSILDDVFEIHKLLPDDEVENIHGVFVFKVIYDSLAHKSGLLPGDIITHIDGIIVKTSSDVYLLVSEKKKVVVELIRSGQKKELMLDCTKLT